MEILEENKAKVVNAECIPGIFMQHLPMSSAMPSVEGIKEVSQSTNLSYERTQRIQTNR
jgi:hypothetical protein